MKRLVGLCVSLAIVALIWWRVDVGAIAAAAAQSDPVWLGLGLSAVVPLTLITAWRFQRLSESKVGLGTACRLVLSASTLNLFMPSKMGDIAKAWVLTRRHGFPPRLALALVVFEKLLDFASLLVWGVLALAWIAHGSAWLWFAAAGTAGLLLLLLVLILPIPLASRGLRWFATFLPEKIEGAIGDFLEQWDLVVARFWRCPSHALGVIAISLVLWAAHLAQFWLFARALDAAVPLIDNMAFATLSILAGLLPFTVAGVGTRDAAIVFFYGVWLSPAAGAVLGVLATMRYIVPAIAGLPFMRDYWPEKADDKEMV